MEPGNQTSMRPYLLRHVLLVEDSIIIAMDAESLVTELGAERVTFASNIAQALSCLHRDPPTLGILDVKLTDETSFPIADRLCDMGIPCIFATGYSDRATFPARHQSSPYLSKPFDRNSLERAVDELENSQWNTVRPAKPKLGRRLPPECRSG